ncbi:MAG: phosphoenolpyruvate-protein phosphotransferase [Bacillota bacterium]|jgi:phosphotransferase system enzyme I (PtsI)
MSTNQEVIIQGLGVSDGLKIGKVFVYKTQSNVEVPETQAQDVQAELALLRAAKAESITELEALVAHAERTLGEEKATIIKGQISFLNDPSFYPPMEKLIETDGWNAATAIQKTVNQVAGMLEAMPIEYMKERAADIRDVGRRLASQISGDKGQRLSDIQEPVILVAEDLAPSETVQLDRQFILGFATRVGGKTSHTAILAQSLGIAAVLGLGDAVDQISSGDLLVINGSTGECIIHPTDETISKTAAQMKVEEETKLSLARYANRKAVTLDGVHFEMAANIGTPEEAEGLLDKGAEAVGLYRTEFLFMSRNQMPDEETQFKAYKAAAEALKGKPVVIRTLDIGGDKELPYLTLPHELNPFLGYRAVRLCLDDKPLFKTQLRAILRASAFGNLKVMFPMISGASEWRQAKALWDETRAEVIAEGHKVADKIELGIMIEIPSAALMARTLAKEVDFFSIGTNDLVQYTVAVDRMNEKVAYLYDYFHPAVIRLIKEVIDASNEQGKWTGMCGSMAGDPLAAPLLAGLGLHEWSMSSGVIHKVKRIVTNLDHKACQALATRILELSTPEEIRAELVQFQANIKFD